MSETTIQDELDAARDGLIADDEVTDGGDEPIKSVTMFTLEFDDTRDLMDEETIRRKILGR